MITQKAIFFIVLLFIGFTSCKKDPKPEIVSSKFSNGIICMNEGLFQQNNANLSYHNLDSNKTDLNVFATINGRGLGDTANDMIEYIYQGKSYIAIAVDVSSQVEIIDGLTLKTVKQIPIFNGNSARSPRALKYYNNYLYVINFDGTVSQIDLASFEIINNITCGLNPDNATIINDRMYIVNSGGLNYPTYDSTVTIIDLNSNTVSATFETKINCSAIYKDEQNELYIISRGNYNNITPKLLRINTTTNAIIETFNINLTVSTYHNNILYYYNDTDKAIHKFNTNTETINNTSLIDCSSFQNIYDINIDAKNNLIYLTDANGYTNASIIKCYDMLGNYKYEFTTGLNTGALLFK